MNAFHMCRAASLLSVWAELKIVNLALKVEMMENDLAVIVDQESTAIYKNDQEELALVRLS